MEKQKHADLIKAWADGAEILMYDRELRNWFSVDRPIWQTMELYRIKPNCEYAFKAVEELGGKSALEAYKAALDGKEIEISQMVTCPSQLGEVKYEYYSLVDRDPLGFYLQMLKIGRKFRVKKEEVENITGTYVKPDTDLKEAARILYEYNQFLKGKYDAYEDPFGKTGITAQNISEAIDLIVERLG